MATQRTRGDILSQYAEGWIQGDAAKIMAACAPAYQIYDPDLASSIGLLDFAAYFGKLKDSAEASARSEGHPVTQPFLELTEVVTQDDGHTLTAWCWWKIPGNGLEGSGLIKVTDQGVVSEKLAYYIGL